MQDNITLDLSAERAFEYQKSLLALLGKVEIGDCDPVMKEHIKTVYELLGKLNTEGFRIAASLKPQASGPGGEK
jgi:hypothetical protein